MKTNNAEEFNKGIKNWLLDISKKATEIQPIFKRIADGFTRYLKEAPEYFFEFSKYGWYIDYDHTPAEIIRLGESLKNGKELDVDKFFSSYYTKNILQIKERLQNNYPERITIINEAFKNHKNKCYYASITLLLTQVDGICYEKTKKLFFINNKELRKNKVYRPEIEEYIKNKSDEFSELFMTPLNQPTAINDRIEDLYKWPIRLNRHEILHGIDTKFGNEINSLKVISFINYMDNLLTKIDNNITNN